MHGSESLNCRKSWNTTKTHGFCWFVYFESTWFVMQTNKHVHIWKTMVKTRRVWLFELRSILRRLGGVSGPQNNPKSIKIGPNINTEGVCEASSHLTSSFNRFSFGFLSVKWLGACWNPAPRRHPPWPTPLSSLCSGACALQPQLHSRYSKLSALFPSSKANLRRNRGNHGRAASRYMSRNPTPPTPAVVFFLGQSLCDFFLMGGGERETGVGRCSASQPTNQILTTFCEFY